MMNKVTCKCSEKAGGSDIPQQQQDFAMSSSWNEQQKIIAKDCVPGTVTPAVNHGKNGLVYAIDNGDVHWYHAEIVDKTYLDGSKEGDSTTTGHAHHCLKLTLLTGKAIEVDEGLLATDCDLVENAGLGAPTHTPTNNPPEAPTTTPTQAPAALPTFTPPMMP
eukprot:11658759-Ditylum_brightwellii.AAC.1